MKIQKQTKKEKFARQDALREQQELEKKKLFSSRKLTVILSVICAAAGFLLYLNTVNYDYALDDFSVIKDNRLTRQGWNAFPEAISKSYRYGYYFLNDELYRPVVKALFAVQWAIAPNQPALGHWTNVLFYALTGFLLVFVLQLYFKNQLLSFVTAMLFITHPVHTEVVANIKSIDEILSFFFLLLVFLFIYRRIYEPKIWHLPAAALAYLLSLFSKESGITFIAIFPVTIWFFTNAKSSLNSRISLVLLGVGILFLIIRFKILEGSLKSNFSVADNLLMAASNPVERFATAVSILGRYLWVLAVPYLLVFDASYNQIPLVGLTSLRFLIPFLIYAGILTFALLRWRKKEVITYGILVLSYFTVNFFKYFFHNRNFLWRTVIIHPVTGLLHGTGRSDLIHQHRQKCSDYIA